jgi:enoyl-CoA hydratase/carnithine racemase
MSDGEVRLVRDGAVATIWFDRPQARNAMTWAMYEGLAAACKKLSSDTSVRVAVLRGGFQAWSAAGQACASGPCAECKEQSLR